MKVDKSVATKLSISGADGLDNIYVFLDDPEANGGRVTITCFDESWSHFWGSIGDQTIAEFFCRCSEDYLSGKLSTDIKEHILDANAIELHARKHICKLRKDRDISKEEAREVFDDIDHTACENPYNNPGLMFRIYGDEWWYSLPEKINPAYTYLCLIIRAVQQAIQETILIKEEAKS